MRFGIKIPGPQSWFMSQKLRWWKHLSNPVVMKIRWGQHSAVQVTLSWSTSWGPGPCVGLHPFRRFSLGLVSSQSFYSGGYSPAALGPSRVETPEPRSHLSLRGPLKLAFPGSAGTSAARPLHKQPWREPAPLCLQEFAKERKGDRKSVV